MDLTWINETSRKHPSQWSNGRSNTDMTKVERDAWINNRRIVRVRDLHTEKGWISIKVFWWTVGGSEYYTCGAQLSSDLEELADAFEKACQLAEVHPR